MASTDNLKGKVSMVVLDHSYKQVIRKQIKDLINAHFAQTLGTEQNNTEQDIVSIFMSMIQAESSFRPQTAYASGTESKWNQMMTWSSIKNKYNSGTQLERSNLKYSNGNLGLTQVTGWYVIDGAGPSGKSEMSRMRPDLAPGLIVAPGVDVKTILMGSTEKQILAGLIVLEDKYKSSVAASWVRKGIFKNKLEAAVGRYMGELDSVDKNKMSPRTYVQKIFYSKNYQMANGSIPAGSIYSVAGGGAINNVVNTSGPVKTEASGQKLHNPGC